MDNKIMNSDADLFNAQKFKAAWEKECMPLLKAYQIDPDRLRKQYDSYVDKRNRSKSNVELAKKTHRSDMLSYWQSSYWHYYRLAEALCKSMSSVGVEL